MYKGHRINSNGRAQSASCCFCCTRWRRKNLRRLACSALGVSRGGATVSRHSSAVRLRPCFSWLSHCTPRARTNRGLPLLPHAVDQSGLCFSGRAHIGPMFSAREVDWERERYFFIFFRRGWFVSLSTRRPRLRVRRWDVTNVCVRKER